MKAKKIDADESKKKDPWINDLGEEINDFATDPYLSERLLAPFNALLNLCIDLADRFKAASAAGKAARAERKAEKAKKAEEKAALKTQKTEERSRKAAQRKAAAANRRTHLRARVAIPTAAALLIVLAGIINIILALPSLQKALPPEDAADVPKLADKSGGDNADDIIVHELTDGSVNGQTFALSSTSSDEDSFVASSDSDLFDDETAASEMYIKERNGTITTLDKFRHHDNHDGITPKRMIDVSSNQGEIDWDKVAASDVDAVMIRIGYRGRTNGDLYEDPCYEYNLKEAYRHGIPFGVYIYSQAITPEEACEEAEFLLTRIQGYELALPVTMDFEYESKSVYGKPGGRLYAAKLSRDEATEVVAAFCQVVSTHGYEPMIYANRDMLSRGIRADKLSEKCKIWIACYGKETKYDGKYTGWQFTDRGLVDGINSYVCLDFWYGDV